MIGYKLFMKPPIPTPQNLCYDIKKMYIYLALIRYYDIIIFQITTVDNKNTQKDVTLCDYKLHIWFRFI